MEKFYFDTQTHTTLLREDSLEILNATSNELPKGLIYNPHTHHNPEIILILNGISNQWVNGQLYTATKGDIILLNPGTIHSEVSISDTPVHILSCALDHLYLTGLEDNHLIAPDLAPIIHCEEYFQRIQDLFSEMTSDIFKHNPYRYEIARVNVIKLLYYIHHILASSLSSEQKPPVKANSQLTTQIRDYIDTHYSEAISLDSLSKQFYISSYHIVHQVKKDIGISPISYLINRRLGEAQRYLLFSDKPFHEISTCVGYTNYEYFFRLFTKRIGLTPTEYRNQYLK